MPEANWACPICQAGHLDYLDVSEGIIKTHLDEHYGKGGSTATLWPDGKGGHWVVRDGNGNRWANREPTPKLNDFAAGLDPHVVRNPLAFVPPKRLVEPDVCRVCWHDAHPGMAACQAVDPVDINPGMYACGCTDYVDEAAEGRIVVNRTDVYGSEEQTTPEDGDPARIETILTEAQGLVYGERQMNYTHPMGDFTAMGRISAAIIERWLNGEGYTLLNAEGDVVLFPDIPPRIATMLMQAVKLSREASKPKRDNRVDGAGYWLCTDRAITGE